MHGMFLCYFGKATYKQTNKLSLANVLGNFYWIMSMDSHFFFQYQALVHKFHLFVWTNIGHLFDNIFFV